MKRMSEVTSIKDTTNNLNHLNENEDTLFEDELPELPTDVLLYEIDGPMFFGASQKFQEVITDTNQQPKILILRMRSVPFIDATGINRLKEMSRLLQSKGTAIIISGANRGVKTDLLKAGIYTILDKHNIHNDIHNAILRAKQILRSPI